MDTIDQIKTDLENIRDRIASFRGTPKSSRGDLHNVLWRTMRELLDLVPPHHTDCWLVDEDSWRFDSNLRLLICGSRQLRVRENEVEIRYRGNEIPSTDWVPYPGLGETNKDTFRRVWAYFTGERVSVRSSDSELNRRLKIPKEFEVKT